MNYKLLITAGALALGLGACGTVPLPPNVSTVNGGNAIGSVDFSYQTTSRVAFSKLKVCVASNVSSDAVTLTDSAGSFVGPATGHYYQNGNSQTVQSSQTIKYIDDEQQVIIAKGNMVTGMVALGLTRNIARFELQAAIEPSRVKLLFVNIAQAQENTGSAANSGFYPVATTVGAHSQQVYDALQSAANHIKACLGAG